jgi:hypothetical protein
MMFKVYRDGKKVAECHYPSDAAAIAGMTPSTEVRVNRITVFREPDPADGYEWSAAMSWDLASEVMIGNIQIAYKGGSPMVDPCPDLHSKIKSEIERLVSKS